MAKKYSITGFFLGLIVLVALLLQAFHSEHHLEELLSKEHCKHKYDTHKTEFSHAHYNFEDCFVCKFTFSNATYNTIYFLKVYKKAAISQKLFFNYTPNTHYFLGNVLALRGPPKFKFL
jgi:hypothetical protein